MASDPVPQILSEPEILRDHLVEMLGSKSDLAGAVILSRKTADLTNQIRRSIDKDGLLVLVIIPSMKIRGNQSAHVTLDPVSVRFRVVENPPINRKRTGKSALYVATRIAAAIQLHKLPFAWSGILVPEDNDNMRELAILTGDPAQDEDVDYDGWEIFYRTKITIAPRQTTN